MAEIEAKHWGTDKDSMKKFLRDVFGEIIND
jgi:hypothetical protein